VMPDLYFYESGPASKMGQQRPDTKPGPRRAYRAGPGPAGAGSPRGNGAWQHQAYPGAAEPRLETAPN
jgi:hypothetical protein